MIKTETFVGDCRDILDLFYGDNHFDSVVTDPPYGLAFMGKEWDKGVPGVEFWREAFRVLKPGGHLIAFSGTRTYHRMVCAIEDAGFEIRDQLAWVYGSGFPKSLDVSKAIDKAAGAEREVVGSRRISPTRPAHGTFNDDNYVWQGDVPITAPTTDAAKQWQGWGTALKPAWEPIVLARKPLIGTVAANVLAHGTGGLNIAGCRVPGAKPATTRGAGERDGWGMQAQGRIEDDGFGRWPANLLHDGSDEVLAAFPQAKGQQGALTGDEPSRKTANTYGEFAGREPSTPRGDTGSAARFFYCPKASKKDRGDENKHPTVKPTELMRYLLRLITPVGGTALDLFMGSGSTGKAAALEGFNFVGIDLSPEYVAIADARIAAAKVTA